MLELIVVTYQLQVQVKRRTSHEPNRMLMKLMRVNKGFFSFAFDSAHVKYGVLDPGLRGKITLKVSRISICLKRGYIIVLIN